MDKKIEDARQQKPWANEIDSTPKWQKCFETMELVKITPHSTVAGVVAEFIDSEHHGISVDIVGKDYNDYLAWKSSAPKAVETPVAKSVEKEIKKKGKGK